MGGFRFSAYLWRLVPGPHYSNYRFYSVSNL